MTTLRNTKSSLQKAYRKCCELSRSSFITSSRFYKELENKILFISDTEMADEDIPLLCRFLASKQAHSEIKAVHLIRSGNETVKKKKIKVGKVIEIGRRISVLSHDNFRLLRAVIECISRCDILLSISIIGVNLPNDLLEPLGSAMFSCKSNFLRLLTIRHTNLKDDGLLVLTSSLAKCKFQIISLDRCGLSDVSCNYLASIIKAQEAMMDTQYWNSTLRIDSSLDEKEVAWPSYSGLQVISLVGNRITSTGIIRLAKHLRSNQWLLGLNFASNYIDSEGIVHLAKALENNTTLHTIVLADNPGYTPQIGQTLDQTAIVAHAKLKLLCKSPEQQYFTAVDVVTPEVASVIERWLNTKVSEEILLEKANSKKLCSNSKLKSKSSTLKQTTSTPAMKSLIADSPTSQAVKERAHITTDIDFEELDLGSRNPEDDSIQNDDVDSLIQSFSEQDRLKCSEQVASWPIPFEPQQGVDSLEYAIPIPQTQERQDYFELKHAKKQEYGQRPPSRISARDQNIKIAPPLRSLSPATLPSTVMPFPDELSSTVPAFRISDENNTQPKFESDNRPISARGTRSTTGVFLPSPERPRPSSASANRSSLGLIADTLVTHPSNHVVSKCLTPKSFLAKGQLVGEQLSRRKQSSKLLSNSISIKPRTTSSSSILSSRDLSSICNNKRPNSPFLTTQMYNGIDRTSRLYRPQSAQGVLKSTSNKTPTVRMSASAYFSLRGSKISNKPRAILSPPIHAQSSSSVLRPSSPPSNTSSASKVKPKSPLEQMLSSFEQDVVKKINIAVNNVTTNLEAVSRQLLIANESLQLGYGNSPPNSNSSSKVRMLNQNSKVYENHTDRLVATLKHGAAKDEERDEDNANDYIEEDDDDEDLEDNPVDEGEDESSELFDLSKTVKLNFKEKRNGSFKVVALRPNRCVDGKISMDEDVLPDNFKAIIEKSVREKLKEVVKIKMDNFSAL